MSKQKYITIGAVILFAFAAALTSCVSLGIPPRDNSISKVDVASVPDGTYRGTGRVTPPFGTVAVFRTIRAVILVSGGKITEVSVRGNGKAGEILAPMSQSMLEQNRPDVDVVSGATWASLAYGKAVAGALTERKPAK